MWIEQMAAFQIGDILLKGKGCVLRDDRELSEGDFSKLVHTKET